MQFTAGDARACNQSVCRDVQPTDQDPPGHTYVHGSNNAKHRIKRRAVWTVPPERYILGTYPPDHTLRDSQRAA